MSFLSCRPSRPRNNVLLFLYSDVSAKPLWWRASFEREYHVSLPIQKRFVPSAGWELSWSKGRKKEHDEARCAERSQGTSKDEGLCSVQESQNTESLAWPTFAFFKASFRLNTSILSDLLAPPCFLLWTDRKPLGREALESRNLKISSNIDLDEGESKLGRWLIWQQFHIFSCLLSLWMCSVICSANKCDHFTCKSKIRRTATLC